MEPMSNRFTQLYSIEPNQYQAGAPVLIATGALLKDIESDKVLLKNAQHVLKSN